MPIDRDKDGSRLLRWGWRLTILWIVALAIYAVAGVKDYAHFQELDKFGSFLQGAFAPLAFLWLVTTVLLQSRELQLQREELNLNREELRKSVEQFTAQTGILEKQIASANAAEKERECNNRIANIARRLVEISGVLVVMQGTRENPSRIPLAVDHESLRPLVAANQFDEYLSQIASRAKTFEARFPLPIGSWRTVFPLEKLSAISSDIHQIVETARGQHLHSVLDRIKSLELSEFAITIEKIVQEVSRMPKSE